MKVLFVFLVFLSLISCNNSEKSTSNDEKSTFNKEGLSTNEINPETDSQTNIDKTALSNEIVDIPDVRFKAYLVGNKDINRNGDNDIQLGEAQSFNGTIRCEDEQIKDLTGIEAFTSLTELYCSGLILKSLDVSKNTNLLVLNCTNSSLKSLDVTQNTSLTELNCGFNELTSLDVSKNTALKVLTCIDNPLKCVVGCTEECNLDGATRCP